MTGINGISFKDSKDDRAKVAIERIEQLKGQLNLSSSPMSRQAPKDIEAERAQAEFSIEALTHLFYGGPERYKVVKRAYEYIKNDPLLVAQPPRNFVEFNKDEMREFSMGQIYRLAQLKLDPNFTDKEFLKEIIMATKIYNESTAMRLFVHDELFKNVINMLGNEDQIKKYDSDVDNYRIYGCFAMTELGHSSALRELETTATYDLATDEFIIDSPSVTSTKWWIGGSGQTSTHAVVIANTIIHGKPVGLNWFVVPLRDKISGALIDGVFIGDIGLKSGHQGVDNGWIQFRQKRIPRSDMLQRWVSLDRHGNYTPAPNPAVMYATLIPERLSTMFSTCNQMSQVLTIATRYGVVRRQGNNNQQIMDYQSHYAKIIPAIAFIHVLRATIEPVQSQMNVLTSGGKMDPRVYLNHMGELHSLSASIKGIAGWYATEILETCRRSCGGHAYSYYNSIGYHINEWGVVTTGAGDNVVLLQQAANYLVSKLKNVIELDIYPQFKFNAASSYIKDAKKYLENKHFPTNDANDCIRDFYLVEQALNTILVKRLYSIYEAEKNGTPKADLILETVKVGELHACRFFFSICAEKFGQPAGTPGIEPSVLAIMKKLTALWGLHVLNTYGDQGFKEGYISPEQIKSIEKVYVEQCKALRSQVVGLTDAFGHPDFILKAPIGRYDGDIYQPYLETLLNAPKSTGIPSYHAKYIKPLTERQNPNQ